MAKGADLGNGKIGKLLFSLAVPTITAQVVNMLYNIVDRIYIGHMPDAGAQALTGVGLVLPVIMLISAFSALIGMGGSPRAAIMMGKQKNDEAERIMGNCLSALLVTSVLLTVAFQLFGEPLLWAIGASDHRICGRVYEDLCIRDDFRTAFVGNECVYYDTRLYQSQYADCNHRSSLQHSP